MNYTASMDSTYDPSFILSLFRKKLNPESEEALKVLDSLDKCTNPVSYCSCGCGDPYFVDPKGKDWKFRTNLTLWYDKTLYVLDIMEDWTVGAIETQRDFPMPLDDMQVVEID